MSNTDRTNRTRTLRFGEAALYRIVVQGSISANAAEYLGGVKVAATDPALPPGVTTLVGLLPDQAALSGVLNMLYDLHLPILEVKAMESEKSAVEVQVADVAGEMKKRSARIRLNNEEVK